MFKVGDKVVVRKNKTIGQVNFNYMRIHTINHVVAIPFSQRINLDSFSENLYVSSDALIHATPEEIAAGHRIDCKKFDEGEVMKNEFEKLFKSQRSYRSADKEAFIKGCEAVYQQHKVDELTKQRDSFIKAYEIEMDKSVDLQKRLDAALKMISINRGFAWMPESISQLEQVLKGGRE